MKYLYESIPSQVVAFEVIGLADNEYGHIFFELKGKAEIYRTDVKDGESVQIGDYIIFLSADDIYRCPRDVFEAKYREVSS